MLSFSLSLFPHICLLGSTSRGKSHETPHHPFLLLHYFDQRRVDIIDQVELWSPRQVTHLPHVWDILLPLA